MLSFLLIYLSISVIAGSLLIYFIVTSPEGWEDKEGFHYIKPEKNFVKAMKFSDNVVDTRKTTKILGHS